MGPGCEGAQSSRGRSDKRGGSERRAGGQPRAGQCGRRGPRGAWRCRMPHLGLGEEVRTPGKVERGRSALKHQGGAVAAAPAAQGDMEAVGVTFTPPLPSAVGGQPLSARPGQRLPPLIKRRFPGGASTETMSAQNSRASKASKKLKKDGDGPRNATRQHNHTVFGDKHTMERSTQHNTWSCWVAARLK